MAEPLLEVIDLTCVLGGVHAVDDASMQVLEGSLTGIVGPNGAGKTTLFNAITGFVPITSGDVRWKSKSIVSQPSHRIANRGLSRTFQNFGGYAGMTVSENLAVASRSWDLDQHREVIDLLELDPHLDRLVADCGLATRKLVGVAMAVVRRPQMLLLDEPLAGLDVHEREDVVDMIRRVHDGGVTIVLIEHDVDRVLDLVDQAVILDSGQVVAAGNPADLADKPELRNVYLKA